ncbi:MAG: transposase [Deltaproteobacteria bacterium]|nr:transposase [Deltaproteobacteria bacterium]
MPEWATTRPVYRQRRPTVTPLYPVVQHHLETFLTQAAETASMGSGVPFWVEKDFRAYLRCGILAHGFARARCEDCGHERLIPFSCKGRGLCPSCTTRRMAEVAAHVTDNVLPDLPVRQWVLSLPKRLRPFLHHNPDIAGAVLRIFLRAIRTTLCRVSPGAPRDAKLGAISFLHRFGSSLNTHFHYHVVVLDGVFSQGPDSDARFHEAVHLDSHHWLELQRVVQRRVLRYFRDRELLDEADADGMLGWRGSGGFSIDASVRIQGDDREGVERLIRYCARPPFALERLHAPNGIASLNSPDTLLLYRFPKPTPDGRTQILLSPLQLLERLAEFIPPPRIHRNRYHGVLAPNAKLRPAVVAIGRRRADAPYGETLRPQQQPPAEDHDQPARPASPARIRWAMLLARIYEVLPLLCPACGGQMSVLAFLTDPPVVAAILLHLELPHRPPPISPARGPPQGDFILDQTPAFDPAHGEPIPDFVFDQSLPGDFDA